MCTQVIINDAQVYNVMLREITKPASFLYFCRQWTNMFEKLTGCLSLGAH